MGQYRNSTKIYSFSWGPTHPPPLSVNIPPGVWPFHGGKGTLKLPRLPTSLTRIHQLGPLPFEAGSYYWQSPPGLKAVSKSWCQSPHGFWEFARLRLLSPAPSLHCAMQFERSLNSAPFPRASGNFNSSMHEESLLLRGNPWPCIWRSRQVMHIWLQGFSAQMLWSKSRPCKRRDAIKTMVVREWTRWVYHTATALVDAVREAVLQGVQKVSKTCKVITENPSLPDTNKEIQLSTWNNFISSLPAFLRPQQIAPLGPDSALVCPTLQQASRNRPCDAKICQNGASHRC